MIDLDENEWDIEEFQLYGNRVCNQPMVYLFNLLTFQIEKVWVLIYSHLCEIEPRDLLHTWIEQLWQLIHSLIDFKTKKEIEKAYVCHSKGIMQISSNL